MHRAYKLLGILQSYAPTLSAQSQAAKVCNRMRADRVSEKDIETHLVVALHDGLVHGRWFWGNGKL